ncbi:MAG: LemA family protein [Gemmatimonadales bacterium]|nr:LemA family protein [Gemmatimonadales bacterium]
MKRVILAVAAVVLSGCGYNRIQTLDEQVNSFKSQIEVQLQRRADLVPNLVETVRGFAQQEQTVFGAVADARARLGGAVQSGNLGQMAEANQGLTSALGRLLAISEAYPELKSNENFRALQDQLEGTENRIATSRQDYNNSVQEYNGYIRKFPQLLTAKVIGKGAREYFEVTAPGAREAPRVNLTAPAPPAR